MCENDIRTEPPLLTTEQKEAFEAWFPEAEFCGPRSCFKAGWEARLTRQRIEEAAARLFIGCRHPEDPVPYLAGYSEQSGCELVHHEWSDVVDIMCKSLGME